MNNPHIIIIHGAPGKR